MTDESVSDAQNGKSFVQVWARLDAGEEKRLRQRCADLDIKRPDGVREAITEWLSAKPAYSREAPATLNGGEKPVPQSNHAAGAKIQSGRNARELVESRGGEVSYSPEVQEWAGIAARALRVQQPRWRSMLDSIKNQLEIVAKHADDESRGGGPGSGDMRGGDDAGTHDLGDMERDLLGQLGEIARRRSELMATMRVHHITDGGERAA